MMCNYGPTIVASCALLVLLGCLPVSDNPLPVQQDISSEAQPLLGDWTLIEMLGMPDIPSVTASISLESNSEIRVNIEYQESTDSFSCFFHKIGTDMFVSRDLETEDLGSYSIHKLEINGQTENQINVYQLDSSSLVSAINDEELMGQVSNFEGRSMIRITDSSENLSAYVSSGTNTVESRPVIVLQKL